MTPIVKIFLCLVAWLLLALAAWAVVFVGGRLGIEETVEGNNGDCAESSDSGGDTVGGDDATGDGVTDDN